jgi:hypothetical protein
MEFRRSGLLFTLVVVMLQMSQAAAIASCRPALSTRHAVAARCGVSMGRAENRAAQKRKKKGGGGSTAGGGGGRRASTDTLTREQVALKLREVPVFGLLAGRSDDGRPSYLRNDDGCSSFFLDAKEARDECTKVGGGVTIEGITLDQVAFDKSCRLKADGACMREARAMAKGGTLSNAVQVPLFAIDGLLVEDKETKVASTPLFFSRAELLQFACTCMENAEERVIVSDLSVVLDNMLAGPAGLLRNSKFFPTAAALKAMDDQELTKKSALFPDQPPDAAKNVPDVFAGALKNLFPGR